MTGPTCLKGAVAAVLALGAFGATVSWADGTGRVASLAAACSGCHAGPAKGIVSLKGMDAETMSAALMAYKADAKGGTVMHRLARGYSDEEVKAIAAYLAAEGG